MIRFTMTTATFVTSLATLLFSLAAFSAEPVAPATNPIATVTTKYGIVKGAESTDTFVFKGIPYAAPPVGALRFAPPREPKPWKKPFSATAYANICAQYDLITKKVLGSEDCLKLNIWRPKNITRPLPVMVFIHGGGNTIGAGAEVYKGFNIYDGEPLAKDGVVIVTLNYRLGAFGFLAHASLESSDGQVGNYALLDLLQGLHFVKENIAGSAAILPKSQSLANHLVGSMFWPSWPHK